MGNSEKVFLDLWMRGRTQSRDPFTFFIVLFVAQCTSCSCLRLFTGILGKCKSLNESHFASLPRRDLMSPCHFSCLLLQRTRKQRRKDGFDMIFSCYELHTPFLKGFNEILNPSSPFEVIPRAISSAEELYLPCAVVGSFDIPLAFSTQLPGKVATFPVIACE